MKVLVPLLRSRSGSDVYVQDLEKSMTRREIFLDVVKIHGYFEIAPRVARPVLWRQRRDDYALIHSNADYGTAFKLADLPFVVTVHHDVFDPYYQRWASLAQKAYHYGLLKKRVAACLESADKIVAVSHSTKMSLERTFNVKNIDVVYNGVDADFFRPQKVEIPENFSDKIKLLFVGNLSRRKGADLLPKIMEKLGNHYVLFYTGAAKLGSANAFPLGRRRREELPAIYNMSDIFLFPSRLEGFGYAVAEAMSCAKPVIGTNSSSLPELVTDQKGGFLCEREDVDDFVAKIRLLSADRDLRQSMGEFNRTRITRDFTLDRMSGEYARHYRSVASRGARTI